MALQKQKILANGISGNYWKITQMNVCRKSMKATFILSLYIGQGFAEPIDLSGCREVFTFPVTKEEVAGDLVSIGYTKIKDAINTPKIPAVPSQPAETDEDGNIIKPLVQGKPAVYKYPDLVGFVDV